MSKPILILCAFFLVALGAYAQDQPPKTTGKFDPEKLRRDQLAFYDRKGKKFIQPTPWSCTNGKQLNLADENKPTVLFFGFSSCVPCRLLMAALADVVRAKAYRNYRFVYLTFDDSADVNEEIGPETRSRLKIVHLSKEYINEHNLVMGYPTIYFLKADNTITTVQTGGVTEGRTAVKTWWKRELGKLK